MEPLRMADVLYPVLLVKAVLAILAVILFLYYRRHWEKAKHHLPIHFFYTKWKTAWHALILGFACIGFAAGFTIELLGAEIGLSDEMARLLGGVFETGALLIVLYMFFTIVMEDVPSYQHIAEHPHRHHAHAEEKMKPRASAKRGRKGKRRR